MVDRAKRGTRGFTIAETMVALTISSVLVVLITTVFLVQNRYSAVQAKRMGVQDVARSVTQMVSAEVRAVAAGGVVEAQPDRLVVRSPMAVGGVCRSYSADATAQFSGGVAGLETDEIAGFAVLDASTGRWSFYHEGWATFSGGLAPNDCAANGADTVGAYNEFLRLGGVSDHHGSVPPPGTLMMLFRETTFALQPSELVPGTVGLFRAHYGGGLLEYASGLDDTAQFQYRLRGSSSYTDDVRSRNIDRIDAIRLIADARQEVLAGERQDIRFGWSVNIPLRNVR